MKNERAYYGAYGGQYVSESLMNTLDEVDRAFEDAIHDPEFLKQYHYYLKQYVGRETPLYFAERLSEKYGTKIYLKREDLNHTGAHKINNVIGQILLAKRICGSRIRMSYRNAWKKPASDLFTIYRNCSVPSQF